MNPCHFCGEPSTIHLTDIVNKTKREMHLCEACGRAHNLIPEEAPTPQLNLPALLQLIMSQVPAAMIAGEPPAIDPATLICPNCGLKYAQFRADGRFGCAEDYDIFREPLMPLLERVHRETVHVGKVPQAVRSALATAERRELSALIEAAVAAENYEEAARLRDRLRQKDGPG